MTTSPYEELRNALTPADWTRSALCANPKFNPEMWFVTSKNRDARATAKALCARCPVAQICRDEGQGQHGIWGGRVSKPAHKRQVPVIRAEVLTP